jgi:biopolymer transport protein ExbD
MRHLVRSRPPQFAITFLLSFHATLSFAAEPTREVYITVADGPNCVIEETRLLCTDVLKHLRDVLRLPAGSRVRFRVEKDSTYESTMKVVELLQKSEYKVPVGYINVAEFPDR